MVMETTKHGKTSKIKLKSFDPHVKCFFMTYGVTLSGNSALSLDGQKGGFSFVPKYLNREI